MSAAAEGHIAVLGGGAWGTALATALASAGRKTILWARDPAIVAAIMEKRENPRYLPGIALDPALVATDDLQDALAGAGMMLSVIPTQEFAAFVGGIGQALPAGAPLVNCSKGIDLVSGRLLSQILAERAPDTPAAALSGPSFAHDVARGLPTAVTVAALDEGLAGRIAAVLSTSSLRCYSSTDLPGVEAGGALKNVMAIAAGAAQGARLGASAQAAIVTRGFAELRRIAGSFGARPETLFGLSGLGDLILTCGSAQSRNFAYGIALGRGEALAGRPLAEGVSTARIAARVARDRGIDAPVTEAVAAVLDGFLTVGEAVEGLLSRPLRSEE